ncbi:MAG: FHA domain-containing protein [Deltaproteobacteria bacterium]|nr:MAG: FHA domain-containing protein [Deltaproteobacteria bacterium]
MDEPREEKTEVLDDARIEETMVGEDRYLGDISQYAALFLVQGPYRGEEYTLARSINRIGRQPKIEVSIPSERLRPIHARIVRDGSKYWLMPHEGDEEIFLNGKPLKKKHRLREEDLISIGDIELVFVTRTHDFDLESYEERRRNAGKQRFHNIVAVILVVVALLFALLYVLQEKRVKNPFLEAYGFDAPFRELVFYRVRPPHALVSTRIEAKFSQNYPDWAKTRVTQYSRGGIVQEGKGLLATYLHDILHQVVKLESLFPGETFASRQAALQTLQKAFPDMKPEPHKIFLELRFERGITIDALLYAHNEQDALFEVLSPRGYELVSSPELWRTLHSILLELDDRRVRGRLEEETKEGRRKPTEEELRKIEAIEETFQEHLRLFDEEVARALHQL